MKITINVTQEDIDWGVPGSHTCCPIARAAQKIGIYGYVNQNSICSEPHDLNKFKIKLPEEATYFISRFDAGYKHYLEPFSFMIDLPENY